MAETKYKDYLAARILTESQPVKRLNIIRWQFTAYTSQVTYRLLSRAIQVNVSAAKWWVISLASQS